MLRSMIFSAVAVAMVASPGFSKSLDEMFPGFSEQLPAEVLALINDLDFQTGNVTIDNGRVALALTEDYYFLGPKDANHVLTEVWGNPNSPETLGMIFPASASPLHDTWGLEISYEDIGYVSDEDAAGYDYNALLKEMRRDIKSENAWRKESGYPQIELVGWAEPPRYDQAARKLYWAKELKFEGDETNTLNYNIRALGREGVLVMNFIATMDQLPNVMDAAPDVLALANFTPGNTYADFNPSVDKVAAVGIGGLIAGKVLAKSGFLAVALIFLKKFWFLALLPLIWLKKLVFRNKST